MGTKQAEGYPRDFIPQIERVKNRESASSRVGGQEKEMQKSPESHRERKTKLRRSIYNKQKGEAVGC